MKYEVPVLQVFVAPLLARVGDDPAGRGIIGQDVPLVPIKHLIRDGIAQRE